MPLLRQREAERGGVCASRAAHCLWGRVSNDGGVVALRQGGVAPFCSVDADQGKLAEL